MARSLLSQALFAGIVLAGSIELAAVSRNVSSVDVFGIGKSSIWHKYFTKYGWEPQGGFEELGDFDSYGAAGLAAASWGADRADIFFSDDRGAVYHKYWDGSSWQPSDGYEELRSTGSSGPLAVTSWGPNRYDIVTIDENSKYLHLYWDGSQWNGWEQFLSEFEFSSPPSLVSWGLNRFDVFGIASNGSVMHLYWNGDHYVGWELLGWQAPEKGFSGHLTTSSWGDQRMDVWAVSNGSLYHTFWDHTYYGPWEFLGKADFETAPSVTHWGPGRIDIMGKSGESYKYKFWDGYQWNPSYDSWYTRPNLTFSSEPVLTSWGKDILNVLGITTAEENLAWQMWNQSYWIPDADRFISLGKLATATKSDSEQQLIGSIKADL